MQTTKPAASTDHGSTRKRRFMPGHWVLATSVLLAVLLAVQPARADLDAAIDAMASYTQLTELQYAQQSVAVPPGGISWTIDTAQWTLESGQIWLQQPTAGKITGLVFEGSGRFEMTVPDPYELRQLRRFSEQPDLERFEQSFSQLVLRSEDALATTGLEAGSGNAFRDHPLATERHEEWLKKRAFDSNARIAAALQTPGDRIYVAEINSQDWGWLTYRYDAVRSEEISLQRYKKSDGYLESWVSLDRPEQRDANGRPAVTQPGILDLKHVAVKADLLDRSSNSSSLYGGRRGESMMKGQFEVTVNYRSRAAGLTAVPFSLHSLALLHSISGSDGREIPHTRAKIGDRGEFPIDQYSSTIWVFLPEPLEPGLINQLTFTYQLEMPNYAGGRSWYPTPLQTSGAFTDVHTARFELTTKPNHEVRAMGTRISETTENKLKTSIWEIERPAKMVTFCWAQRHYESTQEFEGVPDIITFSAVDQLLTGPRLENVSIDVVNAINFFQSFLDEPLPNDTLYASMINAGHGQAFDGYLHLSESSAVEHPGATELFRAHEVAHQWWGHIVGWQSYRDQWISEAFAEYSAMMYVQAGVKNGEKHFQDMLQAYTDELNGSIKSAFSKFARPGVSLLNKQGAERIGPISHGYRAGTGDVPTAYTTLAYRKGPLVLHMIRTLLQQMTKSDDMFRTVLRDFVETYRGKAVSTADFEAILTKHVPRPWGWFFDQWVYGNDIPTYEWNYTLGRDGDQHTVELTVHQKDVPPGFQMAVPVRAEFGGDKMGEVLVMIDEPQKTITIPLPAKPKKVIFNPDYAVLAKMKKL